MKHWLWIICLVGVACGMAALRRWYQVRLVTWSAHRAGLTLSSGRTRGLVAHGAAFLLGAIVLALGYAAWLSDGSIAYARYPAALAVLLAYVPAAAVGAPKLTKWQKSHEQRLVEAGAARQAARGWDSIARVFSVVGVLLGFAALFLVAVPN